jgi:CRP-like cAMP-binding protein
MRKILYYFGQLGDEDVEWIAEHGRPRSLRDREVLVHEGKQAEAVHILLDGKLTVSVAAGGIVSQMAPGELAGELSFVDSRPPSATVTARGFAHVLSIDKQLLQRRLDEDAAFAVRFYKGLAVFLADRLRATNVRSPRYRDAQSLSEDLVLEDELDGNVLDTVSEAGQRFDRLLRAVSSRSGSS